VGTPAAQTAHMAASMQKQLGQFQPHEISILTGAGMLEPLGHPPANTPKFFSTESLAELRDNQKWLEKATDAISTYWRRKNGQKRAGRNGRTSPSSRASGG